jgi:hypothetical protein
VRGIALEQLLRLISSAAQRSSHECSVLLGSATCKDYHSSGFAWCRVGTSIARCFHTRCCASIEHALSRSIPLYADELFGDAGASGEAAPGLMASSGARLVLTSGGDDVLRPAYGPRGSRVRCRHPRIQSHRTPSRNSPTAPAGTDLGPYKPAVRKAADDDCCYNADRDTRRWSACVARVRANALFSHKLRDGCRRPCRSHDSRT